MLSQPFFRLIYKNQGFAMKFHYGQAILNLEKLTLSLLMTKVSQFSPTGSQLIQGSPR